MSLSELKKLREEVLSQAMIIFKIVFSIVAIIIIVMGIRLMYLMYKFEKILKGSCPDDDDMKDSEIWRRKEQETAKPFSEHI